MEAGQFDSETLWQVVRHQVKPGDRVLIVRGDTPDNDAPAPHGVGRNWLAQRLQEAGAQVDYVVAYQRGAPAWDAAHLALARDAAVDGSLWIFSSAEAVGNLHSLLPAQDWSQARAVATHSRIAEAVQQLGFARVLQTQSNHSKRAGVDRIAGMTAPVFDPVGPDLAAAAEPVASAAPGVCGDGIQCRSWVAGVDPCAGRRCDSRHGAGFGTLAKGQQHARAVGAPKCRGAIAVA